MSGPDTIPESLRQRLAADPRDAGALIGAGSAALDRGDFETGSGFLRRALEVDPGNPRPHFDLAMALLKEFRLDAALHHARAASELAPENEYMAVLLAILLRMTGKAEQAVAILTPLCHAKGENPRVHQQLALALQEIGAFDAAVDSLRAARNLQPDNIWFKCNEATLLADRAARSRLAGRSDAKRIALHLNKAFHYGILRPIFDALCGRHHCLLTENPAELKRFDPDVVIVSDAQAKRLRTFLPHATYVYTRHSLINKGHTFPTARTCDYFCVSSEEVRDLAVRKGGFAPDRVWVTGYAQLDPLFAGKPLPLPFDLPPDSKTLLYAPAFNAKLSSAPMLGDRLVELLRRDRPDLNVIIKPHPVSFRVNPDWIAWWRRSAASESGVHLVADEGADMVPYLLKADLVISDATSVPYAYLATDRPIVLLTNPEHRSDPGYDPDGVEWRWRDIGEEVFDVEDLPEAIARALDGPDRFAERRAHYRRRLFGDLTDGRAGERIAERVTALKARRPD